MKMKYLVVLVFAVLACDNGLQTVFSGRSALGGSLIMTQPASALYMIGTPSDEIVALFVDVAGQDSSSYSFQWYSDDDDKPLNGGSLLAGQTNRVLDKKYYPTTAEAGIQYYWVKVTNKSSNKSENSKAATITIEDPNDVGTGTVIVELSGAPVATDAYLEYVSNDGYAQNELRLWANGGAFMVRSGTWRLVYDLGAVHEIACSPPITGESIKGQQGYVEFKVYKNNTTKVFLSVDGARPSGKAWIAVYVLGGELAGGTIQGNGTTANLFPSGNIIEIASDTEYTLSGLEPATGYVLAPADKTDLESTTLRAEPGVVRSVYISLYPALANEGRIFIDIEDAGGFELPDHTNLVQLKDDNTIDESKAPIILNGSDGFYTVSPAGSKWQVHGPDQTDPLALGPFTITYPDAAKPYADPGPGETQKLTLSIGDPTRDVTVQLIVVGGTLKSAELSPAPANASGFLPANGTGAGTPITLTTQGSYALTYEAMDGYVVKDINQLPYSISGSTITAPSDIASPYPLNIEFSETKSPWYTIYVSLARIGASSDPKVDVVVMGGKLASGAQFYDANNTPIGSPIPVDGARLIPLTGTGPWTLQNYLPEGKKDVNFTPTTDVPWPSVALERGETGLIYVNLKDDTDDEDIPSAKLTVTVLIDEAYILKDTNNTPIAPLEQAYLVLDDGSAAAETLPSGSLKMNGTVIAANNKSYLVNGGTVKISGNNAENKRWSVECKLSDQYAQDYLTHMSTSSLPIVFDNDTPYEIYVSIYPADESAPAYITVNYIDSPVPLKEGYLSTDQGATPYAGILTVNGVKKDYTGEKDYLKAGGTVLFYLDKDKDSETVSFVGTNPDKNTYLDPIITPATESGLVVTRGNHFNFYVRLVASTAASDSSHINVLLMSTTLSNGYLIVYDTSKSHQENYDADVRLDIRYIKKNGVFIAATEKDTYLQKGGTVEVIPEPTDESGNPLPELEKPWTFAFKGMPTSPDYTIKTAPDYIPGVKDKEMELGKSYDIYVNMSKAAPPNEANIELHFDGTPQELIVDKPADTGGTSADTGESSGLRRGNVVNMLRSGNVLGLIQRLNSDTGDGQSKIVDETWWDMLFRESDSTGDPQSPEADTWKRASNSTSAATVTVTKEGRWYFTYDKDYKYEASDATERPFSDDYNIYVSPDHMDINFADTNSVKYDIYVSFQPKVKYSTIKVVLSDVPRGLAKGYLTLNGQPYTLADGESSRVKMNGAYLTKEQLDNREYLRSGGTVQVDVSDEQGGAGTPPAGVDAGANGGDAGSLAEVASVATDIWAFECETPTNYVASVTELPCLDGDGTAANPGTYNIQAGNTYVIYVSLSEISLSAPKLSPGKSVYVIGTPRSAVAPLSAIVGRPMNAGTDDEVKYQWYTVEDGLLELDTVIPSTDPNYDPDYAYPGVYATDGSDANYVADYASALKYLDPGTNEPKKTEPYLYYPDIPALLKKPGYLGTKHYYFEFTYTKKNGDKILGTKTMRSNIVTVEIAAPVIDVSRTDITEGKGWVYDTIKHVFTVHGDMDDASYVHTITGNADSANTKNRVVFVDGLTANIKLDNLTISKDYNDDTFSALTLGSGSKIMLNIVGTNTLTASQTGAGILVPSGATLEIEGSGRLTAKGGANGGAGIGGGAGASARAGTLTLKSGTVYAYAQKDASGFGGGNNSAFEVITIKGGTLWAEGKGDNPGVGGSTSGLINITGGLVTATGLNGMSAGSGTGTINISGTAIVRAEGAVGAAKDDGSGIAGSGIGNTKNINITGGSVVSVAGGGKTTPASDGLGDEHCSISISGGTVIAYTDNDDKEGIKGKVATSTSAGVTEAGVYILGKPAVFATSIVADASIADKTAATFSESENQVKITGLGKESGADTTKRPTNINGSVVAKAWKTSLLPSGWVFYVPGWAFDETDGDNEINVSRVFPDRGNGWHYEADRGLFVIDGLDNYGNVVDVSEYQITGDTLMKIENPRQRYTITSDAPKGNGNTIVVGPNIKTKLRLIAPENIIYADNYAGNYNMYTAGVNLVVPGTGHLEIDEKGNSKYVDDTTLFKKLLPDFYTRTIKNYTKSPSCIEFYSDDIETRQINEASDIILILDGTSNMKAPAPVDLPTSIQTLDPKVMNYVDRDRVGSAGIFVPDSAKLSIEGSGTLNAYGSLGGAGIGGRRKEFAGSIIINSGTVNATGGFGASGLGSGGFYFFRHYINDSDFDVYFASGTDPDEPYVKQGYDNFYYDQGFEGDGLDFFWMVERPELTEGTRISKSIGNVGDTILSDLPGVRHALYGVQEIIINGGTVTATGGAYAAGLGSGRNTQAGPITITGGTVHAQGGVQGAGIGSAWCAADKPNSNEMKERAGMIEVNLEGGTIVAQGGAYGPGIGGQAIFFGMSANNYKGSVNILNRIGKTINVTAIGGLGAAGIGSSYRQVFGFININGRVENKVQKTMVYATGGPGGTYSPNLAGSNHDDFPDVAGGAGIGPGDEGSTLRVAITSGSIAAIGRGGGAGLGFDDETSFINISGGTIIAGVNLGDSGEGINGWINLTGSPAIFASSIKVPLKAPDPNTFGTNIVQNSTVTPNGTTPDLAKSGTVTKESFSGTALFPTGWGY